MFILSGCGWLPEKTIKIINIAYNVVRMMIPAIIIIMGSIDFLKSIGSASDDEIRKNTNNFIHKLVGAAIAFLIPAMVGWIAKVMADNSANQGVTCMNAMLNGTYKESGGLPDQTKPKQTSDNDNNDNKDKKDDQQSLKDSNECKQCMQVCEDSNPRQSLTYDGIYNAAYNECMSVIYTGYSTSQITQYQEEYEDCIDKTKDFNKCHAEWSKYYDLANKYGGTPTGGTDNNISACETYAKQQEEAYVNASMSNTQACEQVCHSECTYN